MKIEKDTVVSVSYDLHASENKEEMIFIERAGTEQPMTFLFGSGSLIEAFEENLLGLSAGDAFEFDIVSENAYGGVDVESILALPIETFQVDGEVDSEMLEIGNYVPMVDDDGNHLHAKVLAVSDTEVTLDFNHALAGKYLHFKGEVLEVRKASSDEMAHGHVHGEGEEHHH